MLHKDKDQMTTTTKTWQPRVLREWTTKSTTGWPGAEVPILPVRVIFVKTVKYNIAMVSEFCWPSIKQKQNVDTILNYDRCKQILTISAILHPCES